MKVDNESIQKFSKEIIKDEKNITKEQLKLHLLEWFIVSNTDLPTIDRRKIQVLKFTYKIDDWVNNFYEYCIDIVEYGTKIQIKQINKKIDKFLETIEI